MTITHPTRSGAGTDQHGLPMTGSTDAIDLYDRALAKLLCYDEGLLPMVEQLNIDHGDVPMTNVLTAYLTLSSTDAPDVAAAAGSWQQLQAGPMNDREQAHSRAIEAWIGGDWRGAAERTDALLQQWPADLLALLLGHQLDFFRGDAANLRDRPARSLHALDPAHPHTAYVRGMLAFGMEESGHYSTAEEFGLSALDTNPRDVWALHAVTHTYEMQGRVDTGIGFMRSRQEDWGAGNLFAVHNWWHLALFHLEAGEYDEALAIFDAHVHNAASSGVPLEMVDASAMLWRLLLDGVDSGDRFAAVADAWAGRLVDEPWYAFNDLHGIVAMAGAGRLDQADKAIERLEAYVAGHGARDNIEMTERVGLPASRAVVSFAKGRYDDVVRELVPMRRTSHVFGGSHAQRDLIQRTLLEAALRGGQHDLARALLSERLTARESSVYGWTRQAQLMRALGRDGDADRADGTAALHRSRFAAAAAASR